MPARKHGGVVAIGDEHAPRMRPVRSADAVKKRGIIQATIQPPGRAEDLVATVLGVHLREHHKLGVAGIAPEPRIGLREIGKLHIGQCQPQLLVDAGERPCRILAERQAHKRPRSARREQPLGLFQ